jgi:hypothetical protein
MVLPSEVPFFKVLYLLFPIVWLAPNTTYLFTFNGLQGHTEYLIGFFYSGAQHVRAPKNTNKTVQNAKFSRKNSVLKTQGQQGQC